MEISGPQVNERVNFSAGSLQQTASLPLSITNDEVALEALEVFNLTLSSPSHSAILLGGTVGITVFPGVTEIAIADDDRKLQAT